MSSAAADRDALGVYGKIPAQGDFVRINASDQAAQSLDVWIQEGLETLHRMGVPFPAEPLYFLHHGHPSLPATVGAMIASHDSVGRVYPMTVFARVDPAWLATRWSGAPLGYGLFLRDATRILHDLARADAQLLGAWTRNLRLPSAHDLAQVDVVCMHALQNFTGAQVLPRMTGDPNAATCWYALKTAVDACDTARTRPSRTPIVLDGPLTGDLDLFAWLELMRRRLQGAFVPTVLWRESAPARMLACVGPPSGVLLRYLVNPEDNAPQHWPLWTNRADAVAQARLALSPAHQAAIAQWNAPLESLLSALGWA
jgi:type VI secretion system protein ImpM